MIFWLVLVTQTGHLLSPMVLAWEHNDLRPFMLRRPIKYVALPAAILIGSLLIGAIAGRHLPNLHFNPYSFSLDTGPTTLTEFRNPFMAMVAVYAVWNAYHFGKQAFGVMSIYRHKQGGYGSRQRRVDLIYCCTVVWVTMLIPFIPQLAHGIHDLFGWPAHPHPFLDNVRYTYLGAALLLIPGMLLLEYASGQSLPRTIFILTDGLGMILAFQLGLWSFAIIGLNHWLVAIGIAGHVHANHRGNSPWPFVATLMGAGFVLFCLLFIDIQRLPVVGLSTAALVFSVTTVGLRLGLGFVHFLYDRWIYKLSDPQVRATIRRDIFCSPIKLRGV
ncbi:MAG: hypothetical protein JO266_17200 [Acidobacteria bacterium]|nr:hypothetical protein [Acidobacteriota bacterium]